MKVGDIVLCPYYNNYFPGKIVEITIKKSWFGLKKREIAIIEMPLHSKAFWEKEWSQEIRYKKIPVNELVNTGQSKPPQ